MTRPAARTTDHGSITGPSPFHLFTLTALAVAAPLYDLLARHPDFLVAHRLAGVDLLSLVAFLSLLLPGALALSMWALGRVAPRTAGAVLAASCVLTIGLGLLAPAHRLAPLPAWAVTAATALVGALLTWCVFRRALARTFLLYLSPACLVVPALFLLHPSIRPLVRPPDVEVAGGGGLETRPPIVVVVFDELPLASLLDAGLDVDADRFPAFAKLAARSHWFENATTVAAETQYAVPALLTGRLPEKGQSMTAARHPHNLFTWLGGAYRMAVFETVTSLCPESLCAVGERRGEGPLRSALVDLGVVYLHHVLPAAWSERLPPVDRTWRDFVDARARDQPLDPVAWRRGDIPRIFESFLASFTAGEPPTLHFLHLNLPHVPWKYLPSGKEYGPVGLSKGEEILRNTWDDREWPTVQALQRHLLQVGYADRLLGRLTDRLEALGLYDPALLVVTADHGISFWPGTARRDITPASAPDVLRVPFLVKEPGQREGTRSRRNVEIIDLPPTLADLLGTDLPWPVDGVSAVDPRPHPRRDRKVYVRFRKSSKASPRHVEALPGPEATVRRQVALFGEGLAGLFSVGPRRELIGRPVAGLRRAPPSAWTVELKERDRFADVDLDGPYLPARVFGHVGGSGRPPGPVAVALNGAVVATTAPQESPRGAWLVTAMVPEESFVEGVNRLELFEIRDVDREPRLAEIATTAPPAVRLARDRAGIARRLIVDGGRNLPVRRARRFRGMVWTNGIVFDGYAVDTKAKRAADEVLVFLDEKLVARYRVEHRSRRARHLEVSIDRPGFVGQIPYGVLGSRDPAELTFIAVIRNVAFPVRSAIRPTSDLP